MVDGMITRRYLALNEDFIRGERELTPPPFPPFKYTPEMIASYKRYENELLNKTTGEEKSEPSEISDGSLSDLTIVSLSSQDASFTNNGQTQASANMMLVFSGGAGVGPKSPSRTELNNLTPISKRRNAVDSIEDSISKKSKL